MKAVLEKVVTYVIGHESLLLFCRLLLFYRRFYEFLVCLPKGTGCHGGAGVCALVCVVVD